MKAVAYHRIVLTLAVLGAIVVWVSVRRAQSTTKRVAETRLPGEFDAKFDAKIEHVRLAGRFEDAVKSLASAAGTNIVVRWEGLEPDLRDRAVRVDRDDVIVGDVLRDLLNQATKEGEDELGFGLEDGVVVIGKTSWVGGVTRFYNVRDFVDEQWVPDGAREVAAPNTGGGSAASAGSGGLFGGVSYPEQLSELSALIMETVDPESWRENGGSQGLLREVNGVFIVSTTWENHSKIERILAAVRREAAAPIVTPAPLKRVLVELSQRGDDVTPILVDPAADGQPISLRVYDVRPLLRDIWNAERDLRQQFFPGLAPERDDDGGVWTATQLEEAVGMFLRENVMAASWRDRGGGPGAMWLWSGRILVRHAADAHSEIEAILGMLRSEFGKDHAATDATSPPAPWPPPPVGEPAPSARD